MFQVKKIISGCLTLVISVLFLGCAKEESVGVTHFSGKNIDSIVLYSLTANLDTIPVFAKKFTYSEDKRNSTEQWYERVEGQENLVPTTFKQYQTTGYNLVIIENDLENIITYEYQFNSNHFIIRYVKRINNSTEYDSVFYQYDDNNYLNYSKSIHLNNTGEFPSKSITNYYYKWVEGNLNAIISKEFRNNELMGSSNTNFQYGLIENPLDYNYNNLSPHLRYGRASKNLADKMEHFYDGILYEQTTYSYLLFPETKSFLEKSYQDNNQTFTKIFYK
jgi:hypothetical protein